MKNLIIVLSVFFTAITSVSAQTVTKKESSETTYTCLMHPEVVSMKEGECSKCGMKLVKTKSAKYNSAVKGSPASTVVETKYTCPMHSEVTGKKEDKCSKCGMKFTETEGTKIEDKKTEGIHHH